MDGIEVTIQKTYTFGSQTVAIRVDGELNWVLGDHLGSTSVTANADGSFKSQLQYTAFGEIRASIGITDTEYRYTNQLRQAELGLYYYVARWYDPVTAHFTSADTIVPGAGSAKAFNRYAYTLYNPIRYNDPSGHDVGCAGKSLEECYKPKPKPTPTSTPIQKTTMSIYCGIGPNGISAPGMGCGPGPANLFHMPIWNSGKAPGFDFEYTQYPGYGTDQAGNPIKTPTKDNGKAYQASQSYAKTKSSVVNVGYSAGVDAALFATELRHKNGLPTDALILIGPNFPDVKLENLFAVDYDGNPMLASDFVTRVGEVSKHTPVLIIDDTKQYTELFEGYNNIEVELSASRSGR